MTHSADPSRRHAYRRQQRLLPRDRPGTLALELLEFPHQPAHALGDFSRQANRARTWRDIPCIHEERVASDDDTSSGRGLSLEILLPAAVRRPSYVRQVDGSLQRRLGRSSGSGGKKLEVA
jgi:hypothetical protein